MKTWRVKLDRITSSSHSLSDQTIKADSAMAAIAEAFRNPSSGEITEKNATSIEVHIESD